jgi:cathepsin H
MKPQNCSAT